MFGMLNNWNNFVSEKYGKQFQRFFCVIPKKRRFIYFMGFEKVIIQFLWWEWISFQIHHQQRKFAGFDWKAAGRGCTNSLLLRIGSYRILIINYVYSFHPAFQKKNHSKTRERMKLVKPLQQVNISKDFFRLFN